MWNRTLAGLTIPGPCRDGEYGESHRLCTYTGTWAVERLRCPAVSGFPETDSLEHVDVSCGEHFEGRMEADCDKHGAWTNVDVSHCGMGQCGA